MPSIPNQASSDNKLDPFDPERLRLSQDFGADLGAKPAVTVVQVKKPHRQEFVRVRPGDEWRLQTCLWKDENDGRTFYLVAPELLSELVGEVRPAVLFTTISRQGAVFLWPVNLPGPDGKPNAWNESSLAAARLAETRWVRVASNTSIGIYETTTASVDIAEPEWPDLTFHQLLKLAFRDRFIEDTSHPKLRQLRGEV